MISDNAYSNSQYQPQREDSSMQQMANFQSPSNMPPSSAQPVMNPFAAEYLNTVKENRSVYGNYLDNSYTYAPHKDKKSHFNTVYDTDAYNPWGKPGGGAPKLDNNTGHVRTKIAGTLRWNLNGETEEDRLKRLANGNRLAASPTKNTLIYRKMPMQPTMANGTPRSTYNNSFREPINNQPQPQFTSNSMQDLASSSGYHTQAPPPQGLSASPPTYQYQYPASNTMTNSASILPPIQAPTNNNKPSYDMITKLEREAHIRSFERMNSNSLNGFGSASNLSSSSNNKIMVKNKNEHELNRVSNKLYNNNGPSNAYPNSPFWFGRMGTSDSASMGSFNSSSGTFVDVRRRKLVDALENRMPPAQNKFVTSMSNEYLPNTANNTTQFVYPTSPNLSNHRNRYENPIQMN